MPVVFNEKQYIRSRRTTFLPCHEKIQWYIAFILSYRIFYINEMEITKTLLSSTLYLLIASYIEVAPNWTYNEMFQEKKLIYKNRPIRVTPCQTNISLLWKHIWSGWTNIKNEKNRYSYALRSIYMFRCFLLYVIVAKRNDTFGTK